MAKKIKRARKVERLVLLLAGLFFLWQFVTPTMMDGDRDTMSDMLCAAVRECDEDSKYPPDLCALELCLERFFRCNCRIEYLGDDEYRVELLSGRTDSFRVLYRVGEDGSLERFQVIEHDRDY